MRGIGLLVERLLVAVMLLMLPVQGFALTVNTNDIADGAVTTPKIANGAVTDAKIANGAVTDAKINGPISRAKIEKHANFIVVAKSGGDYTDPVEAAIFANSVATVDNPYLIKVMPGVYNVLQTVALNSYVSLDGAGITATIIRGVNVCAGVTDANGIFYSNTCP